MTTPKRTRNQALEAWNAIIALTQRVLRDAEKELADEEINAAQFALLAAINRIGPVTQAQLAERLGTTEANISQLITKLDRAGLVQRESVGTAKPAQLTSRGQALLERLSPAHDHYISQQFDPLTGQQLEMLNQLLTQLTIRSS